MSESIQQQPFRVGARVVFEVHTGTVVGYRHLTSAVTTFQYAIAWDDKATNDPASGAYLREWFDHDELAALGLTLPQANSEVETSWASLKLEPGFQQTVNSLASTLRVAYYHGDPNATLDTSESPENWLRMAEAAVKEIWFA